MYIPRISSPRASLGGAAPRWLRRRPPGTLLCALVLALVVALAPAQGATAARAGDTINSTATWMEDLSSMIGNVPLTALAIPGTHDSGTYSIPSIPIPCSPHVFSPSDLFPTAPEAEAFNETVNCPATLAAVAFLSFGLALPAVLGPFGPLAPFALTVGLGAAFSGFARAQDRDIITQLNDGIRYLDLRVCGSTDGIPRICHSLYGTTVQDVIDQVNTFVTAHPKEVVIMDFNHFYDMSSAETKTVTDMLQNTFGTRLVPMSSPGKLTLNAIWAKGQSVITSYEDGVYHTLGDGTTFLWPYDPNGSADLANGVNAFLKYSWPNTYDVATEDSTEQDALTTRPDSHYCPSNFYTFDLSLTPSFGDIISGVFTGDSLQAAAGRSNPVVILDFFGKANSETVTPGTVNIVTADFYEGTSLVADALDLDQLLGSQGIGNGCH